MRKSARIAAMKFKTEFDNSKFVRAFQISLTRALVLGLAALLTNACAGLPPETSSVPNWAQRTGRVIDGGSVVFTESEDSKEKTEALTHAQADVWADVANECSLVPKGLGEGRKFEHLNGALHQAYFQVRISITLCSQAQGAQNHEDISALADADRMQELLHSREQLGESPARIAALLRTSDGEPNTKPDSKPDSNSEIATRANNDSSNDRSVDFLKRELMAFSKEKLLTTNVLVQIAGIDPTNIPGPSLHDSEAWTAVRHHLLMKPVVMGGDPLIPVQKPAGGLPSKKPELVRRRHHRADPPPSTQSDADPQ